MQVSDDAPPALDFKGGLSAPAQNAAPKPGDLSDGSQPPSRLAQQARYKPIGSSMMQPSGYNAQPACGGGGYGGFSVAGVGMSGPSSKPGSNAAGQHVQTRNPTRVSTPPSRRLPIEFPRFLHFSQGGLP